MNFTQVENFSSKIRSRSENKTIERAKEACCSNHSNYYVLFVFFVFSTQTKDRYTKWQTNQPSDRQTKQVTRRIKGQPTNQVTDRPTKWQTDQASDKTDQGTTNQPSDRQTKQQCDKRTYHMTYNQLKSWPINKPNIKLLLTYLQNLRQSSVEHLSLFLAVLEYDSHRNVGYSNGLVSHSHHCVYISAGPSLEETGNQP